MINRMKKIINSNLFFIILLISSFLFVAGISTRKAQAINETTLKGKCGIIFTSNHSGWENVATLSGGQLANVAMGTIDFDNKSYGMKFSLVNPYGASSNVSEVFENSTGTFIFQSFNVNTGIYEYTATNSQSNLTIYHVSILPVNSNNTFLISAYTEQQGVYSTSPVSSGVCQKI